MLKNIGLKNDFKYVITIASLSERHSDGIGNYQCCLISQTFLN